MSYTNYENNYILSAKSERFTAENFIPNIEEAAILLVTKTLAEANAEEILDIVLDHAFDIVCPRVPRCLQLSDKYEKPIITTPSLSNILSVLEMENNLPVQHKTSINYHDDLSSETNCEDSLEEPVFTSPISVKSGPENINILEENSRSKSCDRSECMSALEQLHDFESFTDLKNVAKEDSVEAEGSHAEENEEILCGGSESKMNINNVESTYMDIVKAQRYEKDDAECSENIGDATEVITNAGKIEAKSSGSDRKLSLAEQAIGDVVPDLPVSENDEIYPQIVHAYVLFPDGPDKADDTIATKNESTLTTDMEGDSVDLNDLNKEEDTSSSNETNVVTRQPLVANEVGDLLNYFQQEYNTLESTVGVNVVDKSSDDGMECSAIYEEVKRAVKEIATAVFEGQGDGTPTELSNISLQLAGRQDQSSTLEVPVVKPEPPTSSDQFWSSHLDLEQSQSKLTSDKEEEIAVHESLSEEADLKNFLSDMHKQDEMEEREVQIILHDDEEDSASLNDAVFDSDSENPQFSDYLAASQMDSQEELDASSYQSCSHLNLSLRRSYIDSSKLKKVVVEPYSLEKMAKNMEMKNPKLKADCSRQAVGRIRKVNDSVLKSTEDSPRQEKNSKWSRVRKFLTCAAFKRTSRSSDEP